MPARERLPPIQQAPQIRRHTHALIHKPQRTGRYRPIVIFRVHHTPRQEIRSESADAGFDEVGGEAGHGGCCKHAEEGVVAVEYVRAGEARDGEDDERGDDDHEDGL